MDEKQKAEAAAAEAVAAATAAAEAAEKTATEQSTRIEGLQKALTDQNEAGKRLAEGKTAVEAELATSQAKIKELKAKTDSTEVSVAEQITDLQVKLARAEAVSTHGIPIQVANELQGTPDQIAALAKVMSETYKPGEAAAAAAAKTAEEKKAEEEAKKTADEEAKKTADEEKKAEEAAKKVVDDKLATYNHTQTDDVDLLMKDVTESMAEVVAARGPDG